AMARLKFHPRDALPNATLLARADAVHVELTGTPRWALAEAIGRFRLALEHQDEAVISQAREELGRLVELLRKSSSSESSAHIRVNGRAHPVLLRSSSGRSLWGWCTVSPAAARSPRSRSPSSRVPGRGSCT